MLQVKCDCENIGEFRMPAGKPYTLDIQQSSSDEVRTEIDLFSDNVEEMQGGKGECNLALKFEGRYTRCRY